MFIDYKKLKEEDLFYETKIMKNMDVFLRSL